MHWNVEGVGRGLFLAYRITGTEDQKKDSKYPTVQALGQRTQTHDLLNARQEV
jgi:hypothetical protein